MKLGLSLNAKYVYWGVYENGFERDFKEKDPRRKEVRKFNETLRNEEFHICTYSYLRN